MMIFVKQIIYICNAISMAVFAYTSLLFMLIRIVCFYSL
jgi:hypothetical protein